MHRAQHRPTRCIRGVVSDRSAELSGRVKCHGSPRRDYVAESAATFVRLFYIVLDSKFNTLFFGNFFALF